MAFDSPFVVFSIAVALGCDALAVGLAVGTRNPDFRARFRLWFHFGLFQFFMPLVGWYIGRKTLAYIEAYDHWIAAGLLWVIAAKMLKESLSNDDEEANSRSASDPTRGWSLVALSFATSFDALGVGFSLSMARTPLLVPCVIIGLMAGTMTYTGLRLGTRLSAAFGKRVEMFGAGILFYIGYRLLEI
ncbi:MAG TPA: manganese efflux pump MntP family protein [Candidatus Ozemobacteraceae bacterium]|nr:manganese efflux pump MntP family protein [Candidatus Ozemobacteraceae bacterium]